MKKNILVVHGAHRSGTSAVSGFLYNSFEFNAGKKLLQPAKDNRKGFFENQSVVDLNDKILESQGLEWFTAEQFKLDNLSKEFQDKAINVIENEFPEKKDIILKDPRLCFLFPFWEKILSKKYKIYHLVVLRNVEASAFSLRRRNGFFLSDAAKFSAKQQVSIRNNLLNKKRVYWTTYEKVLRDPNKFLDDIKNSFNFLTQKNKAKKLFIDSSLNHYSIRPLSNIGQNYDSIFKNVDAREIKRYFQFLDSLHSSEYIEFDSIPEDHAIDKIQKFVVSQLKNESMLINSLQETVKSNKEENNKLISEARKFGAVKSNLDDAIKQYKTALADEQKKNADLEDAIKQYKTALADEQKKNAVLERINLKNEKDMLDSLKKEQKNVSKLNKIIIDSKVNETFLNKSIHKLENKLIVKDKDIKNIYIMNDELVKNNQDLTNAFNQYKDSLEREQETTAVLNDQLNQGRVLWEQYQQEIYDLNQLLSTRKLPYRAKSLIKKFLKPFYALIPLPKYLKFRLKTELLSLLQSNKMEKVPDKVLENPNYLFSDLLEVNFNCSSNPSATIIIPIFDQINFTIQCLMSIANMKTMVNYEIIIADDNPQSNVDFSNIKGLNYFRNNKNLGFNANCNQAAKKAKGDYIIFLNNDTYVFDYWLDELIMPFQNHSDVGITGSQILNSDRSLQEAGGIIFNDATGWNWGRNSDPKNSVYSYLREVDYVSGCSLCVKKNNFLKVGGFSSNLEKAYYEDTYLSFKLRESNLKTIYNPFSKLIHFEGISNGKDITKGIKKYQEKNKSVFLSRFKEKLSDHKEVDNKYLNSERYVKKHILIIDEVTPRIDEDSGSNDMHNLIKILTENNFRVHFFPYSNKAVDGKYTHELQMLGVNCLYHPYFKNLDDIRDFLGDIFSHVMLSRLSIADLLFDEVKEKFSSSKVVFNTVDLHSLREQREAKLKKIKPNYDREKRELELCKLSDSTIVISEAEEKLLKEKKINNINVVPLIREKSEPNDYIANERNSIIFIGGFRHTPNLDAIQWFIEKVWKQIEGEMVEKGIKLKIIGSHMPENIFNENIKNIDLIGYAKDLDPFFEKALISIAPLRYGAGLKGKVATSFSYGVPVIGTGIAFEGMPEYEKVILENFTCETPKQFRDKIISIIEDKAFLENASINCVDYFNNFFTRDAVKEKVLKIFE